MYFKFWKCTFVKSYNIYTVTSSFPSKHLLVFKTSSRHVLKMSSKHLQCNNSLSWRHLAKMSWRLLEDILQTVLKKSWKTKNCYAENIFKMSWRHVLKTSWRHVLTTSWRQIKCLLGISVSNESIFNKSISDKFKVNPKDIN